MDEGLRRVLSAQPTLPRVLSLCRLNAQRQPVTRAHLLQRVFEPVVLAPQPAIPEVEQHELGHHLVHAVARALDGVEVAGRRPQHGEAAQLAREVEHAAKELVTGHDALHAGQRGHAAREQVLLEDDGLCVLLAGAAQAEAQLRLCCDGRKQLASKRCLGSVEQLLRL